MKTMMLDPTRPDRLLLDVRLLIFLISRSYLIAGVSSFYTCKCF